VTVALSTPPATGGLRRRTRRRSDRRNRYWYQIAPFTLLPRSESDQLEEAVREWRYQGERRDYYVQERICDLCWEDTLRYHFKIDNRKNGDEMWVGSDCIELFKIPVFDPSGRELLRQDAAAQVRRDKRRMREEAQPLLEALDRLGDADPSFDAEAWKRDIGRRRGLTPARRRELLARFERYGVAVAPSVLELAGTRKPVR
jgi:hypothetical protein